MDGPEGLVLGADDDVRLPLPANLASDSTSQPTRRLG